MASPAQGPVLEAVRRFASGLRYPQLFFLALSLFVVDLIIPDLIPMVDEVLLGLLTLLFARLKERGEGHQEPETMDRKPPEKNITPERE